MLAGNAKCAAAIRGQDLNLCNIEMMRLNVTFYAHIINHFAPCVVSVQVWKDFKATKHHLTKKEDPLEQFLTVSDEAFMLVVLLNYQDRWTAEFELQQQQKYKVRKIVLVFVCTACTNSKCSIATE